MDNLPLNKGFAVIYTLLIIMAAGLINEFIALKVLGDLGGLIVDIFGLAVIFKVWQAASAKKPKNG